MKGNLKNLDALRGLLALYVLAGHARWLLWEGWQVWLGTGMHPRWEMLLIGSFAFLRYGHEAVLVFFALSGYFIHLQYGSRLTEGEAIFIKAGGFFFRRVRRLVPPYLFALILTVVLDGIGRVIYPALYGGHTGDPLLDSNFQPTGYTVRSVLPALAMLPRSLGVGFGSNGPLWSLAFEVVYYLLYPGWLTLRIKSRVAAFALIPLGLGCAVLPLSHNFLFAVLTSYPAWLCGALAAEYFARPRPVLLLTLAASFGCLAMFPQDLPFAGKLVCNAVGGVAFVVLFACQRSAVSDVCGMRWLAWFGVRSYSIYVFHFPILMLFSATAFARWGVRPANLVFALGGAVIATLSACFCFHWIERPFLNVRREVKVPPVST